MLTLWQAISRLISLSLSLSLCLCLSLSVSVYLSLTVCFLSNTTNLQKIVRLHYTIYTLCFCYLFFFIFFLFIFYFIFSFIFFHFFLIFIYLFLHFFSGINLYNLSAYTTSNLIIPRKVISCSIIVTREGT